PAHDANAAGSLHAKPDARGGYPFVIERAVTRDAGGKPGGRIEYRYRGTAAAQFGIQERGFDTRDGNPLVKALHQRRAFAVRVPVRVGRTNTHWRCHHRPSHNRFANHWRTYHRFADHHATAGRLHRRRADHVWIVVIAAGVTGGGFHRGQFSIALLELPRLFIAAPVTAATAALVRSRLQQRGRQTARAFLRVGRSGRRAQVQVIAMNPADIALGRRYAIPDAGPRADAVDQFDAIAAAEHHLVHVAIVAQVAADAQSHVVTRHFQQAVLDLADIAAGKPVVAVAG